MVLENFPTKLFRLYRLVQPHEAIHRIESNHLKMICLHFVFAHDHSLSAFLDTFFEFTLSPEDANDILIKERIGGIIDDLFMEQILGSAMLGRHFLLG